MSEREREKVSIRLHVDTSGRIDRIEDPRPLVSVVIPAYRCGATLGRALDSVLCQDVSLEVLVVDDCSPEDLTEVRRRYEGDSRVRFLKNRRNLGAAGSRNRGVALAAGTYIAFLDADDWWEEGKLSRQIAMLERTDAVLCCTARELVTAEGKPTGRVIPVAETVTYRDLLRHNSINCSSVLVRSGIMKEYKMEHEDSHEDYILWLKLLREHGPACGINEPLLKYTLSSGGKSGSKLESARKTYTAYRYAGLGRGASLICFCRYACHGTVKYLRAYLGGTRKRNGSGGL